MLCLLLFSQTEPPRRVHRSFFTTCHPHKMQKFRLVLSLKGTCTEKHLFFSDGEAFIVIRQITCSEPLYKCQYSGHNSVFHCKLCTYAEVVKKCLFQGYNEGSMWAMNSRPPVCETRKAIVADKYYQNVTTCSRIEKVCLTSHDSYKFTLLFLPYK